MKKKPTKRTGAAVPLALFAIVILSIVGVGLLSLGVHSRTFSIRTAQQIQAQTAADAGLEKALFEMNQKFQSKPWSDSDLPAATNQPLPNCDATFSYKVTGDSSTGYTVQSTGVFNQTEKKVYSSLEIELLMFKAPFFSESGFDIKNDTIIDGYNSDDGSYGGFNQGPTSLGTNSTEVGAIKIGDNALITGDVIVGPGGDPGDVIDLGNGVTITGEQSVAAELKELPSISSPSLTYKGSNPSGTISSSGEYDEITISNSEVLTIAGDVVLVINNNVLVDNSAAIEITEGSSLMLYIGANFTVSNNGHINNITNSPPQCRIYSTASEQVHYIWDNASEFYGAVYAPKGLIEVKNNAKIFGALIGDSVKFDNTAELHGDKALKKGSIDDDEAEFVINRWRE